MTNQKIYYEFVIRNNGPVINREFDPLACLMSALRKDAFLAGYSDRKLSQREIFATVSKIYKRLQADGTNERDLVTAMAEEEFARSGIEPKRRDLDYDFVEADEDLGFPVEIGSQDQSPTGEREIYRQINVNKDGKLGFGFIYVGVELFELDDLGNVVKRSVELNDDANEFMAERGLNLDDYLLCVDKDLQHYE